MSWIKQLFCKHKWEKVSVIEVPDFENYPDIYTLHITEQCKKCGKIKQYAIG